MCPPSQRMEDPFDTVRAQVAGTLANTERQHKKWGEARRRKPVRHDECKLLLLELTQALEGLEADLGDLDATVTVVERNRARFPKLDDAEVESRRNFVCSSMRLVCSIRDDVSTHAPRSAFSRGRNSSASAEKEGLLARASPATQERSARSANVPGPSSFAAPVNEITPAQEDVRAAHAAAINAALDHHAGLQQLQVQQQEETLDVLHESVGRLKNLGVEMSNEISTQKRMLSDLEAQVDVAADAMSSLKAKMQAMAKHKDRGKFCIILVLTIVLILLMYAVIS